MAGIINIILESRLGQLEESTKAALEDFYRTQVYLGSDLWVQVSLTDSLIVC